MIERAGERAPAGIAMRGELLYQVQPWMPPGFDPRPRASRQGPKVPAEEKALHKRCRVGHVILPKI